MTGKHTGRIAPQLKHLASLGGSPDVTTILSTPFFNSCSCSRRLKQVLGRMWPTATFNTLINASHLRQFLRKGSQRPTYERDHVKPITDVNIVGCTGFQDQKLHTSVFSSFPVGARSSISRSSAGSRFRKSRAKTRAIAAPRRATVKMGGAWVRRAHRLEDSPSRCSGPLQTVLSAPGDNRVGCWLVAEAW